jgi:hypothetical protein
LVSSDFTELIAFRRPGIDVLMRILGLRVLQMMPFRKKSHFMLKLYNASLAVGLVVSSRNLHVCRAREIESRLKFVQNQNIDTGSS